VRCKYLDNQINVGTNGSYRLCCMSLEPEGEYNIKTHTPQEWHDSDFHRGIREQMAGGEWPDACRRCKEMEEHGLQSQRQKERRYGPGLSHLDLRLGNSCNLKCISCWHMSSSSIAEEAVAMQKAGVTPLHGVLDVPHFNWADDKTFDKLLDLPIHEVYMTGGEPMMVKHLPRFLERLSPETIIRFNTNCTIWNPKLEKLLRKFNMVIMSFSLDATDDRINYIRHGTKWKEAEENAKRWADFCKVDISPTISTLNAWFYDDIKEYADKRNWSIFENLLMTPDWLHVKNAPDELKAQFQGVDKWMNEPANLLKQEEFKYNINKLDSWRKMYIKDYLPPVAKAYGLN
jgi:organic radical activating enzyme